MPGIEGLSDNEMVKGIFGGDTGADPAPDDINDPETQQDPETDPDTPEGEDDPNEQPEQTPAEQLLAGKYKSVEELEAAYKELERGFHGDRQERAELRRQLTELKAALEEPKKPEIDPKQYREKLVERLYEEPDAVIAELADQIADKKMQQVLGPMMPVIQQQVINNQVQQFMSSVPDAAEYTSDMAAIIQANPGLVNQQGWLEKAYLQAKISRLEATVNKGDEGKVAQAAAAKKAAQMPKGGKGELPKQETDEEKMRKSIFGEHSEKRKMFDF